jgi:hypothetical protein
MVHRSNIIIQESHVVEMSSKEHRFFSGATLNDELAIQLGLPSTVVP